MRIVHDFLTTWQSLLGLTLLALFLGAGIAAPSLAPDLYQTSSPTLQRLPLPPSPEAPLGTLPGPVDVAHELVWGILPALRLGLVAALTTATVGTIIGAASAYHGGLVNRLVLRIADAFLAFPLIAALVLFKTAMRPAGLLGTLTQLQQSLVGIGFDPLVATLILFSWMPYARIVNANVSRLKAVDYIQAARALGASGPRIIIRHLLPAALAPVFVLAARDVGGMVLLSATFTFIGVGGGSAWGSLLAQGRDWIIGPGGNPLIHWWTFLPATVALILFGVAWSLIGDGLSDAIALQGSSHPQRLTWIGIARRGLHRPGGVFAAAAAAGVVLGMAMGWLLPRPSGLLPAQLPKESRLEYLRMTIQSFSKTLDVDLAMRRVVALGRFADSTLREINLRMTDIPVHSVRSFTQMVNTMRAYYTDNPAGPEHGWPAGAVLFWIIVGALGASGLTAIARRLIGQSRANHPER
jgi:peptide/nickel transport system permease protein